MNVDSLLIKGAIDHERIAYFTVAVLWPIAIKALIARSTGITSA